MGIEPIVAVYSRRFATADQAHRGTTMAELWDMLTNGPLPRLGYLLQKLRDRLFDDFSATFSQAFFSNSPDSFRNLEFILEG